MGIQVTWFDPEHTVIQYTYRGLWNLAEFEVAILTGQSMLGSVSYMIDTIIDIRESSRPGESIFLQASKTANLLSQDTGITVIIGADLLTHNLYDAYERIQGQLLKHTTDFRFCHSLEDAYQEIIQARC